MEQKRKELWNMLLAVVAVIAVYGVFHAVGIGCPIKFVTGISCMGCGMTRAWLSVLRLDIKGAFHYHPAFWVPPLFIIFLYLKHTKKLKNNKLYIYFIFTSIMIFVIIYFVRLIWQNDNIVVFQPQNNILSKIAAKFIR